MKSRKKDKGRRWGGEQLLAQAVCILLVLILAVGAFCAPRMISSVYDSRTLGLIKSQNMKLATYQVTYADFEEKLEAIAASNAYGYHTSLLPVEETGTDITNEVLTNSVNKEIAELGKAGVLCCYFSVNASQLVSREKYMLYGRKEAVDAGQENPLSGENPLDGLEVWKLSYVIPVEEKDTEERLTVIMDTAFYKLYGYYMEDTVWPGRDEDTDILGAAEIVIMEGSLSGRKIKDVAGESNIQYAEAVVGNYSDLFYEACLTMLDGWSLYWKIAPADTGLRDLIWTDDGLYLEDFWNRTGVKAYLRFFPPDADADLDVNLYLRFMMCREENKIVRCGGVMDFYEILQI